MKENTVLVVGGSDSGGGAGIAVDLKTLAAFGIHGACAITAVTAQNTLGVEDIFPVPPDFVGRQIDVVAKDMKIGWAKTGMLWSRETIGVVRRKLKQHGIKAVVDPVTVSATGHSLMEKGSLDELWKLIRCSEVITPNIPEAEELTGLRIESPDDMETAGRRLIESGAKSVLIKGGHLRGRGVVDLLITKKETVEFSGERITSERLHGTGCSLASAIAAGLSKGLSVKRAVAEARGFIERAIKLRVSPGKGVKPVNPVARLLIEAEMGRCMREVGKAAELLCTSNEFPRLIPEVGTNIAMAPPCAASTEDVIGLSGRIVRAGGKAHISGMPVPGGSGHVARVILTAMRHDPTVRAGMNIKYSPDILRTCKRLKLTISSFERADEPSGASTMEWGTNKAIRKFGKIPNVIYDRGGAGKEAMIRLLGRSALEVAAMALRIARGTKEFLDNVNFVNAT